MTWQGETFKGKLGLTMAVESRLANAAPSTRGFTQCHYDRYGRYWLWAPWMLWCSDQHTKY